MPRIQSKTGYLMTGACVLIGPICGLDPLGLAPLLFVLGLGSLITYRLDHQRWPVPDRTLTIALGVLLAWAAASCLWAKAGIMAWEKLPELIAIAASALVIPVAIRGMPVRDVLISQRALLFSLLFGLLICLGDIALGGPIKHMHKHWPTIPVNAYDREVVCFSLFLWPAALVRFREGMRWSALAMLGLYTVGILFLQSHSAMVGMVLGIVTFGVAWLAPKLVQRGLSAITTAGFALAIPVGLLLTKWGLDQKESLQFSFRHRIQIWHFTADRILHWPLVGLGLEGSRAIPTADLPPDFLPLGGNTPPLHPHDFFLQIWLELGFVGVCATLYFMVRLFEKIGQLDRIPRMFALAVSAGALAVAAFAFGIWQGWWLACLALLTSMLLLAARRTENP